MRMMAPKNNTHRPMQAMEVAIKKAYPGTVHRWCKWHVLKKAKETLGPPNTKKSDFQAEFHKVVKHMLTEDEFKSAWGLLDKYNPRSHTYMTHIYETRKKKGQSHTSEVCSVRK